MRMIPFWRDVSEQLAAGESVFVAIVVDHSIHSPGTTGARLAVFRSGQTLGTIGGGVMEHKIVERAAAGFTTVHAKPELQRLVHRKDGPGVPSGLICAGRQTNLYAWLDPVEDRETLQKVLSGTAKADQGLQFSAEGFRHVVEIDLATAEQSKLEVSDAKWTYTERLFNLHRIAIFGSGHCGLALSRLMLSIGYHVTVFDTRARVQTILENTSADRKEVISDFSVAAALIQRPALTDAVVMTTSMLDDIGALRGILAQPFPFIGVMGSRSKKAGIFRALKDMGWGDSDLARISIPVGLPMRSNTPGEIAISVAAQLLSRSEQ